MKVAVLFDGAGLARLGLEQAGLDCTGFELNPIAHHLSQFVGSGNCKLMDVRDVDLTGYDAVWASPPCQQRSSARTQGAPQSEFSDDLLDWALTLRERFPNIKVIWVENVMVQGMDNGWGQTYNAAQFGFEPIQNRNRVIGGFYPDPETKRLYKRFYEGICPCVTATEWKGCASDSRRASRFYGRKLTVDECAYHQGFQIPSGWSDPLTGFTNAAWIREQYQAIGNGVPVYMAKAFGEALK